MNLSSMKNISIFGGGTGMTNVIEGLSSQENLHLIAIPSMISNGGSTGRLRDSLNVFPYGTIRRNLVSLSQEENELKKLMNYRFDSGELKGHAVGNVLLSAVEKQTASLEETISFAKKYLNVKGDVIPVTLDHTDLCLEINGGELLYGEKNIDQANYGVNGLTSDLFLEPGARINSKAQSAIENSDFIIFGPGDFYNLISYFLIEGFVESLKKSKATFIYVSNILNRHGIANYFSVKDYITYIERFIGKHRINICVYNTSDFSYEMEEAIKKRGESKVDFNVDKLQELFPMIKFYGDDLVNTILQEPQRNDVISRSVVQHDPKKLGAILTKIIIEK